MNIDVKFLNSFVANKLNELCKPIENKQTFQPTLHKRNIQRAKKHVKKNVHCHSQGNAN